MSDIGIHVSESGRVTVSAVGTKPVLGVRQQGPAWGQLEDAALPSPADPRISGYPENISDEMVRKLEPLEDDQLVRAWLFFYDTETMERTTLEGYTLLTLEGSLASLWDDSFESSEQKRLAELEPQLVTLLSEALYQTFTETYSLPGLARSNFIYGHCGGLTATLTKAQIIALAKMDSRLYFDNIGLYERPEGYSDKLSDELALQLEQAADPETVYPVRIFSPVLEQLTGKELSFHWPEPLLTAGGVSFYSKQFHLSHLPSFGRTVYGYVGGAKKYLQENREAVGFAADWKAYAEAEKLNSDYFLISSNLRVLLAELTQAELLAVAESPDVIYLDDNSQ